MSVIDRVEHMPEAVTAEVYDKHSRERAAEDYQQLLDFAFGKTPEFFTYYQAFSPAERCFNDKAHIVPSSDLVEIVDPDVLVITDLSVSFEGIKEAVSVWRRFDTSNTGEIFGVWYEAGLPVAATAETV